MRGVQLTLDGLYGDGSLVQAGGVLSADGIVQLDGGQLTFTGGAIAGAGTFRVWNSVVEVAAGVTAPSTIQVIGTSNVLLDNASAAVTLWVGGLDGLGYGELSAAAGATDAGTILLQSFSPGTVSYLAIQDTLVNLPTGTIAANAGAGDIPAGLINEGLVAVADDNPIQITGSYVAAGGQITGPGTLYSVTLSVTASPSSPTTLVLHGSSTLLTDNLANTTLWVQGGTLSLADDVTNAGVIHLENIDGGGTQSTLIVGDSLVNTRRIEALLTSAERIGQDASQTPA